MLTLKFKVFLILIFVSAVFTIFQLQIIRLQERIQSLENLAKKPDKVLLNSPGAATNNSENIVLLYNRVPKTGSTSFVGVAYDLCKKSQYHVLHVNVTGNGHVLSLNNQIKFVSNVTEWDAIKPALYHGHFAYIDFNKFGAPKPLYINILRRPLDRFISYYYFLRYGDNFRPHLVRKKAGNTMTFDECVKKGLPECDPSAMWLQVPFFCGHAANCWKPGNKWALTEAKKNLVNNYFLVGVTEELDDFISVLEVSLPRMFKGALDHFVQSNKSHLRQTVQKDLPSGETVNKFKQNQVWQMENEFYEFALDNFHFTRRQTLKNRLQSFMYEKIRPR
ncbi:heparin sulfate O-sulfotransferase [Euwallacea fornicatus]|uniref:heparin sulfate O-sulfotransferase n=1 Tax=Euwallacea fornicatus TaxID=995702 RepID=UPI00338FC7ED